MKNELSIQTENKTIIKDGLKLRTEVVYLNVQCFIIPVFLVFVMFQIV